MRDVARVIDFVVPIHNEPVSDIKSSIQQIDEYLNKTSKQKNFSYIITIGCSGVPNRTLQSISRLVRKNDNMRLVEEVLSGRGRVLKMAWLSSDSDIVVYMDVDLATKLESLQGLLDPLLNGFKGLVIGDRTDRQSIVTRKWHRRLTAKIYSGVVRKVLKVRYGDLQCGFKGLSTEIAKQLIPQIKNDDWLFDSELVILAQQQKIKIKPVPVVWHESSSTSVKMFTVALEVLSFVNRTLTNKKRLINLDRLIFVGLLLLSSLMYLVNLTNNKFANVYYSTAIQSASSSWKAFFFGSFDLSNFITIDKFPIIIWPSALLARVFGFSSLTVLLPYALAGVASSLLLYCLIKRYFGILAGLVASVLFILAPLSSIMFRFNNPDSYLVLMSLALLYCLQRAIEEKRYYWFILCGLVFGLMFQIKTLQALVFLPVVGAVIVWQIKQKDFALWRQKLSAMAGVFIITALSWPIAVSFIAKDKRPIIGGSAINSVWDLILGYNGLSRITGSGSAYVTGGHSAVFGSDPGFFRLINASFFSSVGWFLAPAIIMALVAIRAVKTNGNLSKGQSRQVIFWASSLFLHILVFSFARGKIHAYYSLILLPAITALIAISIFWIRNAVLQSASFVFWLALFTSLFLTIIPALLYVVDPSWHPSFYKYIIASGLAGLIFAIIYYRNGRQARIKAVYVVSLLGIFIVSLFSAWATRQMSYVGFLPTPLPKDKVFATIPKILQPDQELFSKLDKATTGSRWIAMTENSFDSAVIQLATNRPALPLGGFDGNKSLIEDSVLQKYLNNKDVNFYVSSQPLAPADNRQIHSWVQTNMERCIVGSSWQVYAKDDSLCAVFL